MATTVAITTDAVININNIIPGVSTPWWQIIIPAFTFIATLIMAIATYQMAKYNKELKNDSKQRWLYERYSNNANLHDELYYISLEVLNTLEKLLNSDEADYSILNRTMTEDISSSESEKQVYRAWVRVIN